MASATSLASPILLVTTADLPAVSVLKYCAQQPLGERASGSVTGGENWASLANWNT